MLTYNFFKILQKPLSYFWADGKKLNESLGNFYVYCVLITELETKWIVLPKFEHTLPSERATLHQMVATEVSIYAIGERISLQNIWNLLFSVITNLVLNLFLKKVKTSRPRNEAKFHAHNLNQILVFIRHTRTWAKNMPRGQDE